MNLEERVPKVGEFFVSNEHNIYLVLGYSDIRTIMVYKVAACLVTDDNEVVNLPAVKEYTINMADYMKKNINTDLIVHFYLSVNRVNKNGEVKGYIKDSIGIIPDLIYLDESKLIGWYTKIRLMTTNDNKKRALDSVYPFDTIVKLELNKISDKKAKRKSMKENGMLVNKNNIQIGYCYKRLEQSKYYIFIGVADDKYVFALPYEYQIGNCKKDSKGLDTWFNIKVYSNIPDMLENKNVTERLFTWDDFSESTQNKITRMFEDNVPDYWMHEDTLPITEDVALNEYFKNIINLK
jgi:hypothetical protein